MTEADLAALGLHRIPVPIPFVAAGGPVNVVVLEEEGGGLTLFDSGFGSPEALAALEAGVAALGRRFEEVTRIVVSHGHVDHYGGARHVQERHGPPAPPVYAHPADLAKVSESGPRWRDQAPLYGAHLARLGLPAEALAPVAREGERATVARRLPEVLPIGEGEVLRTRHLALEVLHMPGHTPGLLCLHDRAHRVFVSDDHLLERISPNPLIELGPDGEPAFQPLLAYLASVRRLRALEVEVVVPGHGAPFGGHRQVIDRLLAFFEKRQARLVELLQERPRTAFELARELFPRARPGDGFLTLSETVANLEVLEARGAVARALLGGVWRFDAC